MAAYIYKVTAEIVTLDDGRQANVAKYAYKPYNDWGPDAEKANRRMWQKSACGIAERYVEKSEKFTGLVVMGDDRTAYNALEFNEGTFYDDCFAERVARRNEEVLDRATNALCGYTWEQFCTDIVGGDYRPSVDARMLDKTDLHIFCEAFKQRFGREVYVYGR